VCDWFLNALVLAWPGWDSDHENESKYGSDKARSERMKRRLFLFGAALVVTVVANLAQAQGTAADYARAGRFISQVNPNELVDNAQIEVHWIGETPRLWFVSRAAGRKEFLRVDAATGERGPAFDHARLAGALSAAAGKRYEAAQLPFDSIVPADDLQSVRFEVDGQVWRCDLTDYMVTKEEGPLPAARGRRGGGRRGGRGGAGRGGLRGDGRGGVASADGAWRVAARDYNLWLVAQGDGQRAGQEIQLTTDGTAENDYRSPGFSPDSQAILAFRTQRGEGGVIYNIESHPANQIRPILNTRDYDLPGDRLDVHDVCLFDVATRAMTKPDVDTITYNYGGSIPNIHWTPDSHEFIFRQMYRGYQRHKIQRVDALTGAVTAIMDVKADTFVNPLSERIEYLDDTNEMVWTSEIDGWNHIYLLDSVHGGVKNRVTQGEWVVRDIVRVDAEARQIIFTAGGREEGEDPYYVHHYRVNFDGSGLTLLNPGNGTHEAAFSPNGRYLVSTYSRVDQPPVTALYRASDGTQVCELARADVSRLLATDWRWPEPFVAKGRDGQTDIHGVIWRPSNLDPNKKYPVIEDCYPGPHSFFTPKSFVMTPRFQALAELGFIVVKLDGMGTMGRSKKFHDVQWKNLGDAGFPDRIAWIRAAARKYPYMDTSRVGIYGTSAGGYAAARALIAYNDFYKVAVSNSGNQDHRTDKTWWNELWMGYPVGPHYIEQSNIEQAAKLKGKIQLVVGELDTNVNPYLGTYQMVDNLIKADKEFELVVVPGAEHGTAGRFRTKKMWNFFTKNLWGIDPPEDFHLDPDVPVQFYRDNTN
jgi:dienelactone hydrolase